MAQYTKKMAKEILDLWKDKTAYFDKSLTRAEFENMLVCRMRFAAV